MHQWMLDVEIVLVVEDSDRFVWVVRVGFFCFRVACSFFAGGGDWNGVKRNR